MTKPSALQVGGKKAKGRTNKATKTHKRKSMSKKMRHTKKHHKGGERGGEEIANSIIDFYGEHMHLSGKAREIKNLLQNEINLRRSVREALFTASDDAKFVGNILDSQGQPMFKSTMEGKYKDRASQNLFNIKLTPNQGKIMVEMSKLTPKLNEAQKMEIIRAMPNDEKKTSTIKNLKILLDGNFSSQGVFNKNVSLYNDAKDKIKNELDSYATDLIQINDNPLTKSRTDDKETKVVEYLKTLIKKTVFTYADIERWSGPLIETKENIFDKSKIKTFTIHNNISKYSLSLNDYVQEKKERKQKRSSLVSFSTKTDTPDKNIQSK